MAEFTTKSGAKIIIGLASWQDARRLKAAIEKEVAAHGIKIDMEADISGLVGAALSVDSSEAVDAALWPCLARCTRNGEKITPTTFDQAEARADYYEIAFAAVKENLGPLFQSLIAALPDPLRAMIKARELPATP